MKKTTSISNRLFETTLLFITVCTSACVQNTAATPVVAGSGPSASSAPTTQPGSGKVDSVAMLAAHNQWRVKVGVPVLQWSAKLTDMAQQWADHLAAARCSHSHSRHEQYGENIFFASALSWPNGRTEVQNVTPQKVVDDWGSESKDYDYASNRCSSICGHYTQLVWKETKEVGCGMAVCGNNGQIWVCNYYPKGNVPTKRPY
ncbi:hypothetical protein VU07_00720 [Desulfobulbus sp. F4]|nr:hypothetical protein [Desulfobulbus sp. F3]MCW5200330.1 hypothetical protein [Desulfobulbus sp. F4]